MAQLSSRLPAVAAFLTLLVAASPRPTAAIECGVPIVADAVLDRDLQCQGDGIVVAADDVTIDLGGHTVRGPGPYTMSSGVVLAGRSGVSVRNGRLVDFAYGAAVDFTEASTLERLTVRNCQVAMRIWDSNANRIADNVVENDASTFLMFHGPMISRSAANEIVRNTITRVAGGISLHQSSDNRLAGNTIRSANSYGIVLDASLRNLVEDNVVVSGGNNGILLVYGSNDATLAGNDVRGGGGSGIHVAFDSTGAQVTGNLVALNGFTGIEVTGVPATVTRNIAVRNGYHGIEAAAGVTDGGGNIAKGNKVDPQCIGVTCVGK